MTADKSWWKQPGYHLSYAEADPQYPFQRIKFTDGRDTGIMMLAAPFYDTNYYRQASLFHTRPLWLSHVRGTSATLRFTIPFQAKLSMMLMLSANCYLSDDKHDVS